jgi:uncharacterized protein (DUF779 family)
LPTLKLRFGELMFHQSGGCCDGSSPMCFEKGDFKLGGSDVKLGEIDGCEFWMSKDQFEYWKHTQLTVAINQRPGFQFFYRDTHGVQVSDPIAVVYRC